ncbi:hypothetical protein M5D96_013560 [Drosophila gunungcola]|uniref:Uncharacterized protein n=1 Tax=Drosophila gunungcola TaxID=103775 RepID=A0A9Q0BIR3_9MUSC|nr:hypothetical protein M5D96_013560 [Drosophila gunungcola]
MLKFIRGKGQQPSAERQRLQKDLFAYRKLRKGRSTRNNPSNQVPTTLEARPVERQIEARCADDGLGSMVRCLLFAKTYVTNVPELKRQLNAAAVRREDINGISSLGFTNSGEALYMMSSSELQRIALATSKVVQPTGIVEVEPLETEESALEENEEESNKETDENAEVSNSLEVNEPPTASIRAKLVEGNVERSSLNLTNGISNSNSPNRGNDTISSSIGDITVDSVRDHLNLTTTTLCSTTTEETVGRLSVLSTQTNKATTTVNMDEIPDINISNLGDLALKSNTTETSTSSVVIKSVITSISHEKTNGESELGTPKTTTPEESQF